LKRTSFLCPSVEAGAFCSKLCLSYLLCQHGTHMQHYHKYCSRPIANIASLFPLCSISMLGIAPQMNISSNSPQSFTQTHIMVISLSCCRSNLLMSDSRNTLGHLTTPYPPLSTSLFVTKKKHLYYKSLHHSEEDAIYQKYCFVSLKIWLPSLYAQYQYMA
jgi:hypothetical protein